MTDLLTDKELELELLDKRALRDALLQKRKLVEANGLAFYEPHPKQDLFHRAANYKFRYVRTGNRFGKSTLGSAEDCAFALGERSWIPESDPARYLGIPKHSTKGCIIVQDWDKAHEIFTNTEPGKSRGKLFQLLPQDRIVSTKKGRSGTGISEIVIKSIHGGHSTIHLETVRSFVQNPMGLESSDWDWVHVDEPCPHDMWIAVSRGLVDRDGSAWFTCTPVTEPWINDFFIPRKLTRATFDAPHQDAERRTWVITGSSTDNPTINKAGLEAFLGTLTAEERACRINGIPFALSGLIYKDFDIVKHVYSNTPHGWKDAQTPPKGYTVRVFIDPHPKTPHAVLYFATSPTGHTFIFKELFRPGLISDIVEHVLAQIEEHEVEDFLIDPIAYIENPITGTCMADEFYSAGLPVVPAPKDLQFGILKTQAKWRERDEHGNPTLLVHEHCAEFLYEIDRYIWQTDREKPVDVDDHMMENLYRAVLTGLFYVRPDHARISYKPLQVTSQQWDGPALRDLVRAEPKPTSSRLARYGS